MAKKRKQLRVQKPLQQKLSDLDDHLFLLRDHLYRLNEGTSHLKVLSAELRVLACFSSGTEGLLWRLVEELSVPDDIFLHAVGKRKANHPLSKGLMFAIVPIKRGGLGDPKLPPNYHSLKWLIKEGEAVYISGKGLTHEYLIKAVAQQMGSAHEDEGVEYALDALKKIFMNGVEPYVQVLAIDTELVLQIGERVLEKAETTSGYRRKIRPESYGDVSLVIRFGLREMVVARIQVYYFQSYISEVEIKCYAGPQSLVFSIFKKGNHIKELKAKYPKDWEINTDAVFTFEYSSQLRRAHAITNGDTQDDWIDCDIGWIHPKELILKKVPKKAAELVYRQFASIYGRLLSERECLDMLLRLQQDADGNWT